MARNQLPLPGMRAGDEVFIWRKEIDAVSIAHERGLRKARKAFAAVAFVLGALSIVIFAAIVRTWQATSVQQFLDPHPVIVFLPLGFLLMLFAYFERKISSPIPLSFSKNISADFEESVSEKSSELSLYAADEAVKTVEDSYLLAKKNGDADVGPAHLFAGSLGSRPGQILFARLGLTIDSVRDPLRRKLSAEPKGDTAIAERGAHVLALAGITAVKGGRAHLTSLDIFAAAYQSDEFFKQLFDEQGIPQTELENALHWMRISEEQQERYKVFRQAAAFKPQNNMDRAMTAIATPFLDSVSEDLTRASARGYTELLVGRDEEIQSIFRAIEGGGTSVVLVGPSGVGKSAIIEGIADLMVEERVPRVLEDKRLLKLSVPHIVSAQGGNGAEERFLHAMNEVGHSGNIVLVIENIDELVGVGNSIDLSSILASELEKGYTFVIATTTAQGYADKIERSVIGRRLERVQIAEPARDLAIRIVESKVGLMEAKNHVVFTYGAVASAVDLSLRYLHDSVLPDNAISLLKEVALTVGKRSQKITWVVKEDVASMVELKTKIPVSDVKEGEGAKLLNLEEKLHERIIGQEHAVAAVSSALRRARTELRSTGKPIANFLFLGPTGVGKTELAKATSEVFFGNENAMVRFDMSEYQAAESVTRLIGGNGQTGLLTEAIRRNPFSLLLLDELEKASPDILNLFLQVMDDGRLTDGLGQTVDFTNVILIATSNAGTQYIQDEVAKGAELSTIKEALLATELRSLFRPEFLNRFNDVIVFAPLTEADVTAIAYLLVEKVKKQIEAKGMTLEVTDAAIHELGRQGFDPKFGARPLRRTIEEKLENKLADELLKGNIARRDTVVFDEGGKIEVRKAQKL
ncbi:MAG: ATP-dependent Clp protease ATP-binding subunit [Patescibacteria group bacterium]|jgi:ATP-dependent Clp protease ATP-binding subunit ClpC